VHRLYSMAVPLIVAAGAIPTIPTLRPAEPPTSGIVATDDGTIFFIDSYNRTVWRVQPGKGMQPFVTGRNGRALQVDDEGYLYGTHQDASGRVSMWRADGSGHVADLSHAEVPEYGHAFVVDDDGEVIASSGRDKRSGVRLLRAGEHEQTVVAGGAWGFRDGAGASARFFPIGGMTRTADGDLLVTSGASVRRVASDGSVRTVVANDRLLQPRSSLLSRLFFDVQGHLSGIAVGARGEIYVANTARDAVVRINADGTTEDIVTCDHGWKPTGVATANGALYVLEYGNGVRVRRIDAQGTVSMVAMVKSERVASIMLGRGSVSG
jgi:hypothetical protein